MKKLILSCSLIALTLPAYAAESINCATLPTCSSLGYTKTVDQCTAKGLNYLRCPFDTTAVFCEQKNISVSAGYILYSDGTFSSSSNVNSSKTPAGVVLNTTSGYIDVIGLEEKEGNWYTAYERCFKYGDFHSEASRFSWFLPYDPADFLMTPFSTVNTALSKAGGTKLTVGRKYWSLLTSSSDEAKAFWRNTGTTGGSAYYAKTDKHYYRCITRIPRTN